MLSKSFIDNYWHQQNEIAIEKARKGEQASFHKYIYRKETGNKERPYIYVWLSDLLTNPKKALLTVFGISEETINKQYKDNNIKTDFDANEKIYAQHVLEYYCHKNDWDKRFADKDMANKMDQKVKMSVASKASVKGMETPKPEDGQLSLFEDNQEQKWKANPYLMRRIWGIFNPSLNKMNKVNEFVPGLKYNDMVKTEFGEGQIKGFKKRDGKTVGYIIDFKDGTSRTIEFSGDATENVINETKKEQIMNEYNDESATNSFLNNASKDNKPHTMYEMEYWINEPEEKLNKLIERLSSKENKTESDKKMLEAVKLAKDWKAIPDEDATTESETEEQEEPKFGTQEWHDKWDVRLADEFVKGKEKYLNAKPLVSNNAFILFNKIWDQIKDKTKNEQIKWLYNMVKDDYQMSWNESLAYRKQGLSKEEVRFGYINAFLESKNVAEEHENRSQAMMGNQNAKKFGAAIDAMITDISGKLNEIRGSTIYSDKQKNALLRDTYSELVKPITDIAIMNSTDRDMAISTVKDIVELLRSKVPENEKELINNNLNWENIVDLRNKNGNVAFKSDENSLPKGQNALLSQTEKNILALALKLEKQNDPTMNSLWYIEKVKSKLPKLAEKVDNWTEIENNDFSNLDEQAIRDYAADVDKKEGYIERKRKETEENLKPKIGKYINDSTGIEANFSGASIDKMSSSKAIEKSKANGFTVDDHFEVVNNILQLWKVAKLVETRPDKNGSNNLLSIKRFDADTVLTSGKNAIAHITVKESVQHGHKLYSVEVMEIEQKNNGQENPNRLNGEAELNQTSTSTDNNNTNAENVNTDTLKLSQDERDALEYYVQDAGYTYINDKLRGIDETPMEQHHIEAVKNIDAAISRNTVKEKTLYRGIGGNTIFPTMNPYEHRLMELYLSNRAAYDFLGNDEWFEVVKYTGAKDNVEKYLKEIVGKNFNEKGYMSTTKDIEQTKIFSGSYQNGITIEFQNIPDGTHGLDLSDFKEGREFKAEKEVLLQRDLNYKITGAKSVDGKIVLTAEIIPESDAEKTQNRSEAMKDNKNAAGKHNVKPQTESEMKKEQKKEKEARKKVGLPNPGNNVGDRVSAIDDADTWNPNSENYRFKDTGYIAGSRKELASMFIMERAKRGERIDAHELDFDGLEENPRAAEKLITKSNIFGEVDWDGLREKGMSGSTAFLIDRIYASAGSKPDESNAQARKQYVIALNGLRDRFEDCKTVPEVIDTLKEIREEIRGEYVEIKEMPEYKRITDRMKTLNEIMRNKRDELMDLSNQGSNNYNVERQKIVEKYIQKGKDAKLLRWNTRVSEYNIPKEYKTDFENETKGIWDKAYGPWKKAVADFKAELISRGVKEEDFITSKKNYVGKPIEVSWYDYYTLMPEAQEYGALSSELDAYIKKMKVAVSMKNPQLEAWKSLGKRFTDILYSDSFAQHKYDCTKGTYDNWEWLEKEVKVTEKKTGKEKKKFQLLVANQITRKGGRDFNVTSTEDLKKSFNLRDVQSGNWVLKDPASAEFHVRNAAQAFADLADVTGISDDKISLNGRLAMAFGARGTGGFNGTAAAHYEPVERVINLTKFHGGGSLGHEWFHAFDNMITSAMTGDDSISDTYLTNIYHGMTEANQMLLREYIELQDADSTYTNVYRRNQLARQLEKKGVDLKKIKGEKTALQFKIQTAFDDLVKAMTIGDSDMKMNLTYEGKDYKSMLYNMSDDALKRYRERYSVYSGDRKPIQLLIADAGSLDGAVAKINERYENYKDSKSQKNKMDWLKIAAAYYDRKPDGNKHGEPLRVSSGRKVSQFLSDANNLDLNGSAAFKNYWSTTHEMAARAFSSYLEDTLESMGRQNDYLAYASDNKYYPDGKPYPEGEERKRINAAFKKLFEVINSEQAIQKSIDILDKFVIEKSEPRFIIKGGRFLIRK